MVRALHSAQCPLDGAICRCPSASTAVQLDPFDAAERVQDGLYFHLSRSAKRSVKFTDEDTLYFPGQLSAQPALEAGARGDGGFRRTAECVLRDLVEILTILAILINR